MLCKTTIQTFVSFQSSLNVPLCFQDIHQGIQFFRCPLLTWPHLPTISGHNPSTSKNGKEAKILDSPNNVSSFSSSAAHVQLLLPLPGHIFITLWAKVPPRRVPLLWTCFAKICWRKKRRRRRRRFRQIGPGKNKVRRKEKNISVARWWTITGQVENAYNHLGVVLQGGGWGGGKAPETTWVLTAWK